MKIRRRMAEVAALAPLPVGALTLPADAAYAKTDPDKPKRLGVPMAPPLAAGGGANILARAIATPLAKLLG